jgi:hypothetical protein
MWYCLKHRKRIAGGGRKEADGWVEVYVDRAGVSRMTRCAASSLLLIYLILYLSSTTLGSSAADRLLGHDPLNVEEKLK